MSIHKPVYFLVLLVLIQCGNAEDSLDTCSLFGDDTNVVCPLDQNGNQTFCCPHTDGQWGCCPADTYCQLKSGVGKCCSSSNVTNCAAVAASSKKKELTFSSSDVVKAFLLTLGAGLATVLGAFVVLCVDKEKSTAILGHGLAFAAGVMIYISFIEIVGESIHLFEQAHGILHARIYATLSFFGGIIAGAGIHYFVHWLQGPASRTDFAENSKEMENVQLDVQDQAKVNALDAESDIKEQDLFRLSLVTAVAVSLHNFPEGLVTFVGALADPTAGAAIAVAIAIHNIPEGISVAIPLYYSNGSFWKAFLWAFLSGMSEPIGALIGYAIVHSMFGDDVFGLLFGFVGGVMVFISFSELLPTAYKTSAEHATFMAFCGMLVMELSLIFFEL